MRSFYKKFISFNSFLFIMTGIQKPEDITSKEYLDKSLENAKIWCQMHLQEYLQGFQDGFDYEIFCYVIDNEMKGPDMCLDERMNGLIRISTKKIKWYQEREQYFKERGMLRYADMEKETIRIEDCVEVDPESMFVHEITEFLFYVVPEVFLHYFLKMDAHTLAYQIENVNRKERGLKLWPEY